MLHDLLFSLLGKTGSFVKQANNGPFYVDESLHIFSKSEISILTNLVQMGYYYQQIDNFINSEQQGLYARSLADGLDQQLNLYRDCILQIEEQYLKEHLFIVTSLHVRLEPYRIMLQNLALTVAAVTQIRGGEILDYLYERSITGNTMTQQCFSFLVKHCYRVLFQQLSEWMMHGRILDKCEEFFIKRIDDSKNNDEEYNWETSYTRNVPMIPMHFISIQTSEKILFIGKAVKVLNNLIDISELEDYDSFRFNKVIENLFKSQGEVLVELIKTKSELLKHLYHMNLYQLLNSGIYYQSFLEDSLGILTLPQTQQALAELNFSLRKSESEFNDRLSLRMYVNGFNYSNFSKLNNLQIKNNIVQTVNILRMGPSIGCSSNVFRDMKQSIEQGFVIQIVFTFKQFQNKRLLQQFPISQIQQQSTTSLSLVFCSDFTEDNAVYVKVQLDEQKISSLSIEVVTRQQVEILFKWRLDKIDFSEADLHTLKINYQNDELSLIIDDVSAEGVSRSEILQPSQWVRVPFKFQKYVQLELGRCYIGVKQVGSIIDLCSWKMVGSDFTSETQWSGLTLQYKIDYPLSLLITPSLQEKFELFFRYLFPIKNVQYQLQQVWVRMNKKFKLQYANSRILLGLHYQFTHVVNAFYSYFQMDIINVQFMKLTQRLETESNFELMKRTLIEFEQSVSNQLFLNLPQIVKQIFQIILQAHRYIELTQRIDQVNLRKECYKLKLEFDQQFMALFNMISLLTKSTNLQSLLQLITRLDYNGYYEQKL